MAGIGSIDADSSVVLPEGEQEMDPWGAEDDDVDHSSSTQSLDLDREWEARRVQFHNLGYRDGITAGSNSSVQEGFNVGFHEAIEPAFSWGVARGAARLFANFVTMLRAEFLSQIYNGIAAYASLPSSLKELLLKDREAGKSLEALHSTLSSISSADSMDMYYKDSVLGKGQMAEDPPQEDSSTRGEEENSATQLNCGDEVNACCGGCSGEDCKACSTQGVDGLSTIASQTERDDGSPPSAGSDVLGGSSGKGPISEEAYQLILNISNSSDDAKKLEDSSTSQLLSMAIGHPGLSSSTSSASESSSRLGQYERAVSAQLEQSDVNLSCLPQTYSQRPDRGG